MKEIKLEALDPRLREQFAKAGNALKQEGGVYAIQICGQILREHPGAFEVRRLLWESLRGRLKGLRGPLGLLKAKAAGFLFHLKAQRLFKKDVLQVVYHCDEALVKGEVHGELLASLGLAAKRLGWPETRVFAHWAKVDLDPEHLSYRLDLVEVLLEVDRLQEAIEHLEWVLDKHSSLGEAQTLLKNASVAETLRRGNWEDASIFRKQRD